MRACLVGGSSLCLELAWESGGTRGASGGCHWTPGRSDVLRTAKFSPKCPQPDWANNTGDFGPHIPFPDVVIDELDCLNLNVTCPVERVDGGCPVMVWIHGWAMARTACGWRLNEHRNT